MGIFTIDAGYPLFERRFATYTSMDNTPTHRDIHYQTPIIISDLVCALIRRTHPSGPFFQRGKSYITTVIWISCY